MPETRSLEQLVMGAPSDRSQPAALVWIRLPPDTHLSAPFGEIAAGDLATINAGNRQVTITSYAWCRTTTFELSRGLNREQLLVWLTNMQEVFGAEIEIIPQPIRLGVYCVVDFRGKRIVIPPHEMSWTLDCLLAQKIQGELRAERVRVKATGGVSEMFLCQDLDRQGIIGHINELRRAGARVWFHHRSIFPEP